MSEEELERVLSNPENVIVSDFLKDRIFLSSEKEPYSNLAVIFETDSFSTSGIFKNYKMVCKEEEICDISFICEEENIPNFINLEIEENIEINIFGVIIKGITDSISVDSIGPEIKVKISFVRTI
jgi:hypothetical protein